ncbi:hypothetical protein E0500_024445 [Streptomyces sp. KM273126]|nr:hypothetical protein [Streptomyces sp. KM273126]
MASPTSDTYCGYGELTACRDLLLTTLKSAAAAPAAEVYSGDDNCAAGNQWRADAIIHRALGGITHGSVSRQNRPMYQQAVEFPSRR